MSDDIKNDEYATKGSEPVPVTKDESIDTPVEGDPNSDAQIAQDEKDAVDESNIIDERTRGAGPKGSYAEKEEDDIPDAAVESGKSAIAQ